jgi:DUF1680 family protein
MFAFHFIFLFLLLLLTYNIIPVSSYSCDNSLITSATEKTISWESYARIRSSLSSVTDAEHQTHDHSHSTGNVGFSGPGEHLARSYIDRYLSKESPIPDLAADRFPLSAITLLEGGKGWTFQNNTLTWLYMFDADRLLFNFRVTSNLSTLSSSSYGGWEDSGSLLRGHITGGHFLSAAAQIINSTGDSTLRSTISYMMGEFLKCQNANAILYAPGYLSAFPPTQFDCLENGVSKNCPIWSPYYTMAKIIRGLYDVYIMVGDDRAQKIAEGMLSYFASRIRTFISSRTVASWWPLLNAEFGGLNDAAFLWYDKTKSQDSLYIASIFDKACLLGPMALNQDYISGIHANTHIPIVVGAAQGFESTGYLPYAQAAEGYLNVIRNGHTFATGGSSTGEWWGNPHRLGDDLDINGVESCTTYNTLKVSRSLFTWTLDTNYMDFYERSKFSGMFGTMHPTAIGAIIYLLPMRGQNGLAGGSKAHSYWGWSDPLDSMWCCVGSGMESHSKHGELLFMQQMLYGSPAPTLLVTLFDDASITWSVPGDPGFRSAIVSQHPIYSSTNLTITINVDVSSAGSSFSIAIRIPSWAIGPSASVGGQSITSSGSWFNVTNSAWPSSSEILVTLPFLPTLEHLDDDRVEYLNWFAVIAGPFALGAHTHVDNIIVNDNSTLIGPSWIRAVSESERSNSFSFKPSSLIGGSFFLRHDNLTNTVVSSLSFPQPPGGGTGPVSYTLNPPGFIGAGDDIYHGLLTLAEAEVMCTNNSKCVAITYNSADVNPSSPIDMYLKSAASFTPSSGWTTYISSRIGNSFGGDEDGPDSTWIQDVSLVDVSNSVSIRSFNRPGEYLVCLTVGQSCSIGHDKTLTFNTSASWILHKPGLDGNPNTTSFESVHFPQSYLSIFGSSGPQYQLTLQTVQTGNNDFSAASSWNLFSPNWNPGSVAFVASTLDGTVTGSRDFLLTPVGEIASEWYGVYLNVQSPSLPFNEEL